MNKIEKTIYNLVKRTPWIKFLLRNLYQSFFDLLPRRKDFFSTSYQYKENCFFGFHDVDPFSSDCTKILSNQTKLNFSMPSKEDSLNIGYFNILDDKMGDFNFVNKSFAWNFHKGCRLQWISDSEIIFNTAVDNKLVSKIVDISSNKERLINYAIDTVDMKSMKATSFSYERLERCMPGYGYLYSDGGFIDQFIPKETGLFLIDLKKNTRKLLVSLFDIVKDLDSEKFKTSYWHFVTHSEFSPDGRYISFLHRWIGKDIKKRWTRLIIYDLQNNCWKVLPTTDWGVSHYVWNKNNQIVAYASVDHFDGHVVFDIPNFEFTRIASEKLNSDGHQSFIGTTKFVTDTYPDRFRMAKLYAVDIKNEQVNLLCSIYSPKKFQTKTYYKHIACDLHPRVSKNGRYLCFDSPRTGRRGLYVMKIN